VAKVISLAELRSSPTASVFEGREDAPISIFVTTPAPGGGPVLHKHPYPEVFVVEEGEAVFTAGDDRLAVAAGHVVVVPAETPHRFENSGDTELRVLSVHPSDHVQQTDLA
jgi:mannose-6-phosphate isomerase-like protein (cupin superfamily)